MTAHVRIAADPDAAVRPSARIAKICDLLDCDESQVRRLLDAGEIEGFGLGTRGVRVFLDSVASYQSARRRGTRPSPAGGKSPPRTRQSAAGLAAHRSAMAQLQADGVV